MESIKISVVTTVLNEEDSIHSLLDSLLYQTRLPDELIIVDAGSVDGTLEVINAHVATSPFPIVCITENGVNRSKGRNIGITRASHDYIAVIDAGCEADKRWLEELEAGFSEGFEAVAGFYVSYFEKPIQQLFVPFLLVPTHHINSETFLPSSRSLAFTKHAWKAAGMYPEHLPTCEDLVFADRLRSQARMVVKLEAVVHWHIASTLQQFLRQVSGYAYGDVLAGYKRHIYKIVSMWLRYVVFVLVPPVFLLYLFYRMYSHRGSIHKLSLVPWYVVVMIGADVAILWGSIRGWFRLLRGFQRMRYAQ